MSRLRELEAAVSPSVIEDAIEIGELLAHLQVPHALIGGLAVGLNGFPRATSDVDYLVGSEAFEKTSPFLVFRKELRNRVEVGVIDLLAVPDAYPCLLDQLALVKVGKVHVIAPEALVLMKLSANRPQDRADIVRLLETDLETKEVAAYLEKNAPDLLNRFAELVEQTTTS